MLPCDPIAETHTSATNDGSVTRCSRLSVSRDVQIFGRLHTDLYNVPLFLLPNVQLQIRLTKARPSFYLMNKTADTKTIFKFLDDYLMVRRLQPNHLILSAEETALERGPSRGITWRVSTLRLLNFRPGLNPGRLTMQCSASSPNACCSPWLRKLIWMAQWTQTPTNLDITISANFRFMWMESCA